MKKWLETLKLIVLAILIIVLVLLIMLKKTSNEDIKNVVETFQQATPQADIHTSFFDLSSNYFDFTPEEIGSTPNIPPDDIILNIGGSFGDIDVSQIPWDSENASLTLEQGVYGAVSSCASAALFRKLYMVNQLQNSDTLPYDPNTNHFKYIDPLFQVETNDPVTGNAAKVGEDLLNYSQIPLLAAMMGPEIKGIANLEKEISELKTAVNNLKVHGVANPAKFNIKNPLADISSELKNTMKALETAELKLKTLGSPLVRFSKILKAGAMGVKMGIKFFIRGLFSIIFYTTAVLIVGPQTIKIIETIKLDYKVAKTALEKGVKVAETIGGKLASGVSKIGEKAAKFGAAIKAGMKAFAKSFIGKMLGKLMGLIGKAMNLTGWMIYAFFYIVVYLNGLAAALAAAAGTAGGSMVALGISAAAAGTTAMFIFDLIYLVIIMPVVLGLTMSNTINNALDKVADSAGCCPEGYESLDQLVPEWCSMLIQNVPILGDVLGFFQPYICFGSKGEGIAYRHTLTLPKYLNYPHLTTFFLRWPDYDCSTGSAPIHGKTVTSSSIDWNNNREGSYTNLQDVIDSINSGNYNKYRHSKMTWHNGTQKDYTYEYLMFSHTQNDPSIPPPAGTRFFYADFTEPSILVQMAQFYYNYASKDLTQNIDGTVSVQYINKINYVAASSLYSCDVMCEMVTVTYNPLDGSNYSEVISYDHDRRFYFNVDSTKSTLPYWEHTSNSAWKTLDDSYDRAFYHLNDRLHVNQNSNISAEVLLTAYIQKNEAFQRYSDAASNLIHNYSNVYPVGTPIDSPLMLSNYFINQFYTIYQQTTSNYLSLFSNAGLPQPSRDTTFDTALGQPNTPQGSSNAANAVESNLSTVVGYSNALWAQHLSDRPVTDSRYFNQQYTIVGCTKLDETASHAGEADVTIGDYDTRYKVDFNVRPYLKLCEKTHINTFKCMDPSNIEIIIYNYFLKNPNKRIRSIKSIKNKGKNCCEYIWDEDDVDADGSITNSYKDVNTQILYQIDLSSCTFCLPENNTLVGTGSGISNSSPYKMVLHPPSSSDDPNYNTATANLAYKQGFYNKPIFDANNHLTGFTPMSNIDYIPRYFPYTYDILPDLIRPKKPIRVVYPSYVQSNLGSISNDTCANPNTINQFLLDYNKNITNKDKILRVIRAYTSDSNKCDYEVDIMFSNNTVQRKTMTFTMEPETHEGFTQNSNNAEVYLINGLYTRNQAASVCSNYGGSLATLEQMSNFASSAFWTTGGWVADNSNTYSLNGSVNLVATNPTSSNAINCFGVKPRTLGNPNIDFLNSNTRQYYFETPYTFSSVFNSNGGMNIQQNTEKLDAPFLTGMGFNNAYMDIYNKKIVPNITYFNNSLINTYTDNIKNMFNTTSQLKVALNSNNTLHGRTTCSKKCSDPEIMERIIEQYNIDNMPKGRYNQGMNTMKYIFKAGTADDGLSCRVMFDNQLNQYIDYYNADRSSANFLSNDGRPTFIDVTMVEDPIADCVFRPIANQSYSNVPASDPYIASQSLLDYPYFSQLRTSIPQVDINDSSLYMQVMRDYQNQLGHKLESIDSMIRISPTTVDYKVSQRLVARTLYKGRIMVTVSDIIWTNGIIRATYNLPLYYTTGGSTSFTYTPGNFKLHVYGTPLQNLVNVDISTSYYTNYVSHTQTISINSSNASPLITSTLPTTVYTTPNIQLNISLP